VRNAKIFSLAEEREARRRTGTSTPVAGRGRGLPAPDRLWELLDRNISITVWRNDVE